MRIALVCPYSWDRFGGVQSHVRALADALKGRGNEVMVLAPGSLSETRERSEDVTIIGRSLPVPANGSVAPIAFGPLVAARVTNALKEWSPEVMHVHEPLIPSLSLLALRAVATPAVGTFHAAADKSFGYAAARPLLTSARRRLQAATAVSEPAKALVARYFPGEYELTPNGVEIERFAPAGVPDREARPTVLFLGRLERRKGLDVLIQALARLRDLDPLLVVAGAGPKERFCRSLAARLRVDARFLGAVHEDLKPGIFRSADVYCAPAMGGESFGIVLIEAMAAGTPVVCSDLPGFRAVVDGAGLLAPPGDPGRLADQLRRVLVDVEEARRMGVEGRRIAQGFDWSRLAADVESIYRRAMEAT